MGEGERHFMDSPSALKLMVLTEGPAATPEASGLKVARGP